MPIPLCQVIQSINKQPTTHDTGPPERNFHEPLVFVTNYENNCKKTRRPSRMKRNVEGSNERKIKMQKISQVMGVVGVKMGKRRHKNEQNQNQLCPPMTGIGG